MVDPARRQEIILTDAREPRLRPGLRTGVEDAGLLAEDSRVWSSGRWC